MFDNSLLQKHLSHKVGTALLLGLGTWVILIVQGATFVRSAAIGTEYDLRVGPLLLHEFSKKSHEGGYVISVSFESGLLWFFVLWLMLGIAVGFAVYKHTSSHSIQKNPHERP